MSGNRTWVNCLEGSYAHHYTNIALSYVVCFRFKNIFLAKSPNVDDPVQPKDDSKDEANVGTIVGIVIGVLLLLVAVTICVVFMYKQKSVNI